MTAENKETGLTIKADALPATFDEIRGMADAFVKSGMFSDVKQQAQAIVKIQAGRELGLPPVYSMQNINMIRDRLTTSANTIAMMVKRSGKYNYRIKEHTESVCSITFYESDAGKWVEIGESKFTMEDAKRANLVKPDSGWMKFPRAMLFSRAISQGARIYAPDAIGGVYTDEEIKSIPSKPEDGEAKVIEELKTPAIVITPPEQDASNKPTVQPANAPDNAQNKQESPSKPLPIDKDWLNETLKIVGWKESTAISYIKNTYKVMVGKTLDETLRIITIETAEKFCAKLQEMRDAAGK
jgi:hypothetical protein